MKTEPAAIIGGITAFVTAVLALLVAYGVDISQTQQTAILGLVAVVAPLIAALAIRFKVWSPASVQEVKRDAYRAGLDDAQPMDREEAVTDALDQLERASGQGVRGRPA